MTVSEIVFCILLYTLCFTILLKLFKVDEHDFYYDLLIEESIVPGKGNIGKQQN